MNNKLYAFQIFDENSEISKSVYNAIYNYFLFYPREQEFNRNELTYYTQSLFEKIRERIDFFNENIRSYIGESKNEQSQYEELLVEDFEAKIYAKLNERTTLYNNERFIQFITEIINNTKETIKNLINGIIQVYEYFNEIRYYKVKNHDIELFKTLHKKDQAKSLKNFNDYSIYISNPELEGISKNYPSLIDQLIKHFTAEVVSTDVIKNYSKYDTERKINLKDILIDEFTKNEKTILNLIKSDNVNYVNSNKDWIAIKQWAYLLFKALSDLKIIENNISKYGLFIENTFTGISRRSFQKKALKHEDDIELKRLKKIFISIIKDI